jgi:hypothetical protein
MNVHISDFFLSIERHVTQRYEYELLCENL